MYDLKAMKAEADNKFDQISREVHSKKGAFFERYEAEKEQFLNHLYEVAVADCEQKIREYYMNGSKIEKWGDNVASAIAMEHKAFGRKHFWYCWRIYMDGVWTINVDDIEAEMPKGFFGVNYDNKVPFIRHRMSFPCEGYDHERNEKIAKKDFARLIKSVPCFEGDPEVKMYYMGKLEGKLIYKLFIELPDLDRV